jgi:hypothetical protein
MDYEAARLLSACLHRWAGLRGKGIPQGYSASDILAKLYLDPIDHNLRNAGFTHLRHGDDIRIFCRDLQEAKQALLQLSDLLRVRGLNVQSAKTRVYRSDEVLHLIDGVGPVLERITAANPGQPPLDVLERAFRVHFIHAQDADFDTRLFRRSTVEYAVNYSSRDLNV